MIGQSTFSDFGGAVQDLFNYYGSQDKAQGDYAEARSYTLAANYALQEKEYTETSTAIKETQQQRQIYQGLGTAKADITGSGFTLSGSGLDILRSSAAQGALTKQVIGEQGRITEAGYKEQHDAYMQMASAARAAAAAAQEGGIASLIGGGLKGIAGLTTLLPAVPG